MAGKINKLALAVVAATALTNLLVQTVEAKTADTTKTDSKADPKKVSFKRTRISYAGAGHYFVPPPPPYVPNLAPTRYNQYYFHSTDSAEARSQSRTPESVYGKYIYTRSGYKAPTGVQQNKYVTTWSKT